MVTGLDLFREHFKNYTGQYVLIGGTACFILYDDAGMEFRATKDLDIVLCLEALSREFIITLKSFIEHGKYLVKMKSSGKKMFYRFEKPEDVSYPYMIELFSGRPLSIDLPEEARYTPVIVDEQAISLSALLLDADYSQLILNGKTEIDGITVLKAEYMLLLKAKAWLDLSERKALGGNVDSSDIKKHLYDAFRLYRLLNPEDRISLSESVKSDLKNFITKFSENPKVDLSWLGITSDSEQVMDDLRQIYGL
jgi:hypothetical protein